MLGVVPVVEVAPVLLQPVERVERLLEPLDQVAQADVAQVVGGQGRDSSSPVLVGEVRWATRPSGISWKLSGGSQWSSSPTNVSKKCQVLRAIRRRARRSASVRGDLGRSPRPADPEGDDRREEPGDQERGRRRQRRRSDQDHERRRSRSPGRRRPHVRDEVHAARPQPLLGRRGRLPLQQLAPRHRTAAPACGTIASSSSTRPIGQERDRRGRPGRPRRAVLADPAIRGRRATGRGRCRPRCPSSD